MASNKKDHSIKNPSTCEKELCITPSLHVFIVTEYLFKSVINIISFFNLVLSVLLVSIPSLADEHPTTRPPSVPLLDTRSALHVGQICSHPRIGPTESLSAQGPPGSFHHRAQSPGGAPTLQTTGSINPAPSEISPGLAFSEKRRGGGELCRRR